MGRKHKVVTWMDLFLTLVKSKFFLRIDDGFDLFQKDICTVFTLKRLTEHTLE